MTDDSRRQLDAELIEVAELIPDWLHELSPQDFWREIEGTIRAFREACSPEDGDYAAQRIEGYLTACGLRRP